MRRLDEVTLNEKVKILDVVHEPFMKRRLLDLGFIKGNEVIPTLKHANRGICAYEVKGCMIALRQEDAKHIIVSDDEVKECLINY